MAVTQVCGNCGSSFKAERASALYCGSKCRAEAWRERNYTCFYCGDVASERDHVIPHVLTSHKLRVWSGCDTVQSCRECNKLLSDNVLASMAERVATLARLFRKKHKLGAGYIEWGETELADLGPSLHQYIASRQKLYWERWKRLNHMRIRAKQLAELREGDTVKDVD